MTLVTLHNLQEGLYCPAPAFPPLYSLQTIIPVNDKFLKWRNIIFMQTTEWDVFGDLDLYT